MKFFYKNKTLLFGLLLFAVLFLGSVIIYKYKISIKKNTPLIYTVVLGDNGFSPEILKINQGDVVIFKTSGKDSFWPASDPHPTHTDYPDFDPKQPVAPNSSWSFKFGKVGNWKYHDHLFPIYRGEIDVIKSDDKSLKNQATGLCENGDGACYDKALSDAVSSGDLSQAFAVMDNLYHTQPAFASSCHNYSHKLGELAYQKYSQHTDFQLSPESYYCGYGFYHGFMESLLHETGNLSQAKDFCAYVGQHFIVGSGSQAESACYHGIGHGAVDGDAQYYKTSEDYIAPALALCEKLQVDFAHQRLCASGVYNALAIIWNTSPDSLPTEKTDPFWICTGQNNQAFAEGCYEQMNTFVYNISGGSFSKAVSFVEKIKNKNFAKVAMLGVATVQGDVRSLNVQEYPQAVLVCRDVKEALKTYCLENYLAGVVEGGAPGQEYENATVFCNTKSMNQREKDDCYHRLSSSLSIWYPKDKSLTVCANLPMEYQKYCDF
jgi:hypothetical protein